MQPSATENLASINTRLTQAARRYGRAASDIRLIAVSKTYAADHIEPVLRTGHAHFGENRVQEAQAKWPALKERYPHAQLHLIGQLQSNKAEAAVALFDYIHVLDRPSLAQALAKAAAKQGKQVPCYIQVNIGDEPQKGGCALAALPELISQSRALDIPLVGLMCLPPAEQHPAPYFALLYKLAAQHGLPRLSMGMSADFETAIQLGATDIRIGSAIFGARS